MGKVLKKARKHLNKRRTDHANLLRSIPTSQHAAYKTPGSMKRYKG